MTRTVVFDFDYTLADSSRGIERSVNHALRAVGLAEAPYEAVCRTIGLSLEEKLLALHPGAPAVLATGFRRHFIEKADEVMVDATRLLDGVSDAVDELRSRGLRLGICSVKFRRRITAILERHGLADRFDVVVGGEDVAVQKPDPAGVLEAMERMGAAPARSLYVGDSVVDAEAARRAGVPFVAVLSGVTPRDRFAGHPTAAILRGVHELPEWLARPPGRA